MKHTRHITLFLTTVAFILAFALSLAGCDTDKPMHAKETTAPCETITLTNYQQTGAETTIDGIKVELLSSSVVAYKDAEIAGYAACANNYDAATILVCGIAIDPDIYRNDYAGIRICGETATDADGSPAVQTAQQTRWVNAKNTYVLTVIRIVGEVDPAKVDIAICCKDGTTAMTRFSDNGQPQGFELAKTEFETSAFGCGSRIVEIDSRHYFVHQAFNCNGKWYTQKKQQYITLTRAVTLIPLENGFTPTLTQENAVLEKVGNATNCTVGFTVNRTAGLDGSAPKSQTTIEVTITRPVTEEKDSNGEYSREVLETIYYDLGAALRSTRVVFDDGHGNAVTITFR